VSLPQMIFGWAATAVMAASSILFLGFVVADLI